MPCHWVRGEDGLEFMIPECYGGAHDPKECTCDVKGSELEAAQTQLREAQEHIEKMQERLLRRNDEIERLRNDNLRLRTRIRELENA